MSEPCAYVEPMDRTKPIGLFAPQWRSHGTATGCGGGGGGGRRSRGGRRKRCEWREREETARGVPLLYEEATARGIWQEIIVGAMGMEGLLD